MKTTKRKQPIFALLPVLAVSVLFMVTACGEDRLAGCEGQILVENEIPDLTLFVDSEPFRRDVSIPPVVFRHTKNKSFSIQVSAEDIDIVAAGTRINENSERHIIHIEARNEGDSQIFVSAQDDCFDRNVTTAFQVTVLDTTQSN